MSTYGPVWLTDIDHPTRIVRTRGGEDGQNECFPGLTDTVHMDDNIHTLNELRIFTTLSSWFCHNKDTFDLT